MIELINIFKCFKPLSVIASGNSATTSLVINVTFLTSNKLLSHKKSNLVSDEYLNSGLMLLVFLNSDINLFSKPCWTILFALCVFTPTNFFLTFINSSVYLSFLEGSFCGEIHTSFPSSKRPFIEPVFGQ